MLKILKPFYIVCVILWLTACASQTVLEKYKKKADQGDPKSQLMVGDEYYFGSKTQPVNKELGVKYYTLSAEGGNSDAAFNLGRIYEKEGKNEKAVHYYKLSADAGNLKAQDNLGIMYQYGRGVPKDIKKAESLYRQALENGSEYSQLNLAILYKDTQRIDKSIEEFKTIATSPETSVITKRHKKAIAFNLMNLYLSQKDDRNAYIWGAVSVLSGYFDSENENIEKEIEQYETLANQLTDEEKNELAKDVMLIEYKVFQQFDSMIKKRENYRLSDGLIRLSGDETLKFVVDSVMLNKKLHVALSYYKDKTDDNSRINYAIGKLKMAAYNISIGAIYMNYYYALKGIEEAIDILNKYDRSNISHIKRSSAIKLDIVRRVWNYQEKLYKNLNG
ncbi:tetratricopeptide repeat protein [Vibrio gazogenes]|uniref:Sel1 repeat family protein n=1 Tax=Vibrio gazogenes TaxID=687 RepID=A0A1Z2SL52_VIBGA|nr:tetratricopeptide repeat protein [Vibrio gazogenes]ASA57890.1 hypothetical protein BSQ33_19435 [Vibrio gazogenes]